MSYKAPPNLTHVSNRYGEFVSVPVYVRSFRGEVCNVVGNRGRSVGVVTQVRRVTAPVGSGPSRAVAPAPIEASPGPRWEPELEQARQRAATRRALDGRAGDAARWLERLSPATLPPGVERTVNDDQSKWYRVRLGLLPLAVVVEIEIWHGELWAHMAVTGRNAAPAAAEVAWCRDLFLGDRKAIAVLPRKIERTESSARTVDIYAPLESDALPSCARACVPSHRDL